MIPPSGVILELGLVSSFCGEMPEGWNHRLDRPLPGKESSAGGVRVWHIMGYYRA